MKTPTIYYNQGAKYYPKRKKVKEEETLVVCDCCYAEMEEGEGTTIYFFSDWGDVVCDSCHKEYKNGDWVADVEARY